MNLSILKTEKQKVLDKVRKEKFQGRTSEEIYIEWLNNYITIERMAEHYQANEIQLTHIIAQGRNLNHKRPTKN